MEKGRNIWEVLKASFPQWVIREVDHTNAMETKDKKA